MVGVQYARLDSSTGSGDYPKVEVVQEKGDTVSVNGVVIKGKGPHLLGVGQHRVRLEPAKGKPMEAWITLEPKEYRILQFERLVTEDAKQ